MKEELYGLANHIAGAKGGLPQEWQEWADEIEMDIRKLANREAQPVGYIDPDSLKEYRGQRAGGTWSAVQRTTSGLNMTTPIYTAPPAPAVPEEMTGGIAMSKYKVKKSNYVQWVKGWNACRAAMLAQSVSSGYKLNSPEIPDGWVACSERMPEEGNVVLVCQEGGIIYCAEMQDGEIYPDEFPRVPSEGREITYWMPLPAAPEGGNDHDTRR